MFKQLIQRYTTSHFESKIIDSVFKTRLNFSPRRNFLYGHVSVNIFSNININLKIKHSYPQKMASKSALALLANGTEEMEIVITVDVLRRAGVRFYFRNANYS